MNKGTQESAEPSSDQKSAPSAPRATPPPGAAAEQAITARQPRVVSSPSDVAGLVLMQIDLVNGRKDDLTIAIKGLSDLMRQLVRAYGENTQTIEELQSQVKKMERSDRSGSSSNSGSSSSSNGKRKSSRSSS